MNIWVIQSGDRRAPVISKQRTFASLSEALGNSKDMRLLDFFDPLKAEYIGQVENQNYVSEWIKS